MKKSLPFLVFALRQCQPSEQRQVSDYSDSFIHQVDSFGQKLTGSNKHGIRVRNDSIVQIANNTSSFILYFGTGLEINKPLIFNGTKGNQIIVKRLNYTDLNVKWIKENQEVIGKASISKSFFRGTHKLEYQNEKIRVCRYPTC